MINIINIPLPSDKYDIKAPYPMEPIGITIHETDNDASARNEIAYMQRNNNKVSFHFAVDEKEIIQGLPLDRNGWHAGDGTNGKGNRQTIAIEICRNYSRSSSDYGQKTKYYEKARENAEKLVGYLLAKYGWTDKDIYTHYYWVGKNCPRVILTEKYLPTFKKNAMAYRGDTVSPDNNAIMGKSKLTAKQLTDFVKKNNKDFNPAIADAFIRVGDKYSVKGDMALAQSILETGWFKFIGSSVKPSQNNFCGLGATGGGNPGHSFRTIEEGVTAQIQHLYAYASKKALPSGEKLVDPRFSLVTRGIAPKWTDLNGRWATGANYGEKILSIYAEMNLKGSGSTSTPSEPSKPSVSKPKYTAKQIANEIWTGKGNWGNNPGRAEKIRAVGLNPDDVQAEIEKIIKGSSKPSVSKPKYTAKQIANEIWTGKGNWGNNPGRAEKIRAVGLNPDDVQAEIEKIIKGSSKPSAPKPTKTASQIADEIWIGKGNWGTGDTRVKNIKAVGVDPAEVQRIIKQRYYK